MLLTFVLAGDLQTMARKVVFMMERLSFLCLDLKLRDGIRSIERAVKQLKFIILNTDFFHENFRLITNIASTMGTRLCRQLVT
jgi:hypothetical protein